MFKVLPGTDAAGDSAVGRKGGEQAVRLAATADFGAAIHEIGHCVGLWHEQSRADRDLYVTILYQNIEPGKQYNFNQKITDGRDVGPYDYDSIMHYPRYAFPRSPGLDTIVPKKADAQIGQRTHLSEGDIAGVRFISSFGSAWQALPGRARNISIGSNGTVFHVGTTNLGNRGYDLNVWKGSHWNRFGGYADAVQVAVGPDGRPWHVNKQGLMYRWNGNSWDKLPGRASNHQLGEAYGPTLAVGADGSVFHVGTTHLGAGGFDLNRWHGSGWQRFPGAEAVHVAVAPDGSPWHVNAQGQIYRWRGNTWQHLPGKAMHIAIGRDGTVWHVGTTPGLNGYNIARWNEQAGDWDANDDAAAILVAVEPAGLPWHVNRSLNIFRRI